MASNRGAAGDIIPKGYKAGQLQQFTPEQLQLYNQLFSSVGPSSYLSKLAGGDQSTFEQMEAPAWQQFQQAQGQLASRFSGQGLGGRNSSAFQNAYGQLGNDFALQLASRRQELQRNALSDLMGYSNMLLGQRPYDRFINESQHENTFGQKLLGGALRVGGAAAGGYFGGGPGAKVGYQTGNAVSEGFGI